MSPAAFIDANVPIYAAGREHPYKSPCADILRMVAENPQAFITDAEVLQELVHRYLAQGRWRWAEKSCGPLPWRCSTGSNRFTRQTSGWRRSWPTGIRV